MWVVGAAGIVAAIFCGVLAWRARKRLHAMITTETLTSRQLAELAHAAAQAAGPGAFRHTCEIVGTAQVGPEGVLKSDLASAECVWHRHVVTRRYWETRRVRTSNGTRTRRVEKTETVAERRSEQPFLVVDQTGPVPVHPGNAAVEGLAKVVDRFEPANETSPGPKLSLGGFSLELGGAREGTIGYKYEEWVLQPGVRLFVLGEANDASGPVVVADPQVMSTKDEQQLIQESRRNQRMFTILATVAAVAGTGFLVAGFLA